ncbi:MAG TPA: transposase [Terracidiphilus sp.]|jgi:transposase
MAMGTRKQREKQEDIWIAHTELASAPGHPFYQRLNELLEAEGFDEFVEGRCAKFYAAKYGRPSLTPGIYFRSLLIGYFEGIDSERGIAWRLADSLALRRFVGIALDEYTPDHSTISRTRRLIDVDTHREVFGWVLGVLADRGLLKGQRIAIDATTLEANAAMRAIVRRDTGENYEEFLRGLAKASGIATPTREDLARLDRKRKKRMSNQEWKSPGDEDARIAKMKDGRTHLAHKAEHAVDLDTGAVVAVTLQGADQGDTTTLEETLCEAGMAVAEQIGREAELRPGHQPKVNVNGIEELVTDKGYHSGAVVERVKSYEVRSYLPEKQQKGRRNWQGKAEEQQAVYQNRRRVRGDYGKSLLRRRGELVERSFAHCYDTGGMRRTHLRGQQNILKRQLVHVGAFNLSLILRQLLGAGTPREWRNRGGLLLLLVYFLLARREARNWLYRSRISTSGVKSLASPRTRVRRWPCPKSAACTTGC